jgi:hypothetical protein
VQFTRTEPRDSLPAESNAPRVETIAPDECLIIHLRQGPDEPDISWAGVVLSADATAIRFESVWSMCNGQRDDEEGQRCIPWHRVDMVEVVALAEPVEVAS